MAALWALPWDNRFKEFFWRLTVHGIIGGGGHDTYFRAPCGCGCPAPAAGGGGERSRARRFHCFWSCPVAQAVVGAIDASLTSPASCADVWLMRPRADVDREVWPLICAAAIHAMERGRRRLWVEGLAAPRASRPGRGRASRQTPPLSSAEEPGGAAAVDATAVEVASRCAVGWFWSSLQDFVDLQLCPKSWVAIASGHPFIGVEATSLRLNIPTSTREVLELPATFFDLIQS